MTIVNELKRIEGNIKASYTALKDKGAELPTVQNSDNLASTIANLEGGGGESDEFLKNMVEGTLTEINLPSDITRISKYAFRGGVNSSSFICGSLEYIKGENVETIETYGVYGHSSTLKEINFPNLKEIADYGLSNGAGADSSNCVLEKIILGNLEKIGNNGLNGQFNPKSNITQEVQMSFNNCEIGNYAFRYYNLPSFDATGVKSIGQRVFDSSLSAFKKVWLPSTIQTISTSSSNPMFNTSKTSVITIYTDVADESSIPSGWSTGWNTNKSGASAKINVVYNATYQDFLNA